jgi:CheY-like chemotaxis protein
VRAAVDLPDLLRESTEFALHGATSRATFDFDPALQAANADKGQLGQVVQNLVLNAVQAMPGGGTVTVRAANSRIAAGEVGTLPAGNYVRISVADTGTGIAAEHLSKIFDPYFSTKAEGSGLGLTAVYSIVRKHEGHIAVETIPGRGTTFHVWLPVAARPEPRPAATEPAAGPLRARVLIMDDEGGIRDLGRELLRALGAECETAADGADMLAQYRAAQAAGRPFDIVILDLTVPGGMGGREAMEELLRFDPAARAIVSSGYSRDPVLANHTAHGFRGVLPKPYTLDQMRTVVGEVLAGDRERGEARESRGAKPVDPGPRAQV